MPQASYAYAMGRISVMTTRMLDAVKLRRIAEAPTEREALVMLLETGYGGNLSGSNTYNKEIDYIIRDQLTQSRRVIWELTPDPERTKLFLLEFDTHNIKALLKSRLLGIEAPDILRDGGVFNLDMLKDCIKSKNYEQLPDVFKKAMDEVEQDLLREVDPLSFSAKIDGAMFHYIKTELDKLHDHSFVREYFSLMADFQNARSLIRARFLHWDVDKIRPQLLECGDIDFKYFLEAVDTPMEQLSGKLNRGSNGRLIAETIDDYNSKGQLPVFKQKMETALMEIVKKASYNPFGLGPIIGYLLGRSAEAKALRVIFNAKRSGVEVNLPELYQ
jgi:V/A-type H+-transporting ATPase subunit C